MNLNFSQDSNSTHGNSTPHYVGWNAAREQETKVSSVSWDFFSFFVLNDSPILCAQFAEKYGDVFSICLFGERIVIISGYKFTREALVQQGENFVDRPSIPIFEDLIGQKGAIFGNICLIWQVLIKSHYIFSHKKRYKDVP